MALEMQLKQPLAAAPARLGRRQLRKRGSLGCGWGAGPAQEGMTWGQGSEALSERVAEFSGGISTGVVDGGTCQSPCVGESRGRVFLAKEEETWN